MRQLDRLPASLKARIAYAPDRRVFQLKGVLSRDDRMTLQIAMAPIKGADRVIDGLFYRTNRIQASEAGEDREKPAFIVPRLCIWRQSELVLFSEEHFLDLPWDLAECDPVGILDRFAIRDDGQSGYVDVTERGKVEYFLSELHAQLTLAIHEPDWTLPRLVNWIDNGIPHPDVTKPAAKQFIWSALELLMNRKGYTLEALARHKYPLRQNIAAEIGELRDHGNLSYIRHFLPWTQRRLRHRPITRLYSTRRTTRTINLIGAGVDFRSITCRSSETSRPRARSFIVLATSMRIPKSAIGLGT